MILFLLTQQTSWIVVTFPNERYPWNVLFIEEFVKMFEHQCFWVLRSRTSKPPSILDLQTPDHATFGLYLAFISTPLQRQCVLNLSIWSITMECRRKKLDNGKSIRLHSLKREIWPNYYKLTTTMKMLLQKVGKAKKTEFVNFSLLAWLRKDDVYVNVLSHEINYFWLERLKGSPR